MASVLSVTHHGAVVGLWRLLRLADAVEVEEARLRARLTPDQLSGTTCAACGRDGVPLSPLLVLDGRQLGLCPSCALAAASREATA